MSKIKASRLRFAEVLSALQIWVLQWSPVCRRNECRKEPVDAPWCPRSTIWSLFHSCLVFSPWPQGCLRWKPLKISFLLTKSILRFVGNTSRKTVLGKSPQIFLTLLVLRYRKIIKRQGQWLMAWTVVWSLGLTTDYLFDDVESQTLYLLLQLNPGLMLVPAQSAAARTERTHKPRGSTVSDLQ